jgi:hypothetical protein
VSQRISGASLTSQIQVIDLWSSRCTLWR